MLTAHHRLINYPLRCMKLVSANKTGPALEAPGQSQTRAELARAALQSVSFAEAEPQVNVGLQVGPKEDR
jgi:hypothetical protein